LRYRYTKFERCCWLALLHHAHSTELPDSRPYLEALRLLAEHLANEVREKRPVPPTRQATRDAAAERRWRTYKFCVPRVWQNRMEELELLCADTSDRCTEALENLPLTAEPAVIEDAADDSDADALLEDDSSED
jgi:hypothetical protein